MLIGQLVGSHASIESGNLFASALLPINFPWGMEKLSSDRSSTATVLHYQPCKFGEDRSSRCSDDCSDKIYKNISKQQHFTSPVAQSGWANKSLDIQSSDSHACHRQWGECDCYQHWRWRHQLTRHTRCDQLGAGPATPNHPNITQPATHPVTITSHNQPHTRSP